MGDRGDLTDAQWERLEPLLPVSNGRCGRWRDHRQVVNGVLYRIRTGVHWRDLPERNGPWEVLLRRIQAEADAAGEIDWDVSVDSTSVRAHHHAAGARHAPPPAIKGAPPRLSEPFGVGNKDRYTVERAINKLKAFRAVAARFDKRG
ncbi:transposase [Streptomyces cyaneochromogenes]|uniref:Transposase n=1 Tax=Streptomyces cyaneochromogenes TaxID=2496836 RepID=A0A3S9ML85_9ACTN|nr:transposase [Streptomyces cyaneochromogenes]AZQ39965.1 transposase [Streptomyces cyaneochromogenes]